MASVESALIDEAWGALVGGEDAPSPAPVEVMGTGGGLPSPFPVEEVAVACIATALRAAASLHAQGGSTPAVGLDRDHVAAAVRSERAFGPRGAPAPLGFAPLSRFWPTADGWVRTHANYPWHRQALVEALGTTEDVEAVGAALADLSAVEVESRVVAAGGIVAAVRSLDEWRSHPQGRAVVEEPLVGHQRLGEAPPRTGPWPSSGRRALPASGVRVVDLTRVIAGPVATRFLGALGADVVRIDPPHRPDLDVGAMADSLLAKRSAMLDLRAPEEEESLHRLLSQADVVVCGYRPGALERFGLDAEALAARHPGLVIAVLDAWGHHGPWAGRRGFDSVVQAPTGIAAGEGAVAGEDGDGAPGALPCQLLDHGTGYLTAAAVLDGLRRQRSGGGTHVRRLSLARTAWWLTSQPTGAPGDGHDLDPSPWLVPVGTGDVVAVAPPGTLDGESLRWPSTTSGYASDPPVWSPTE